MSHFAFLQPEWPDLFEAASKAESLAVTDPRTACFYARRCLELAVQWAFTHDTSLKPPYRDDLSARIHEPTFRAAAGDTVFYKARAIKDLGNHAVHSHKAVSQGDGLVAVKELFHVCFWLARTYARGPKPDSGLKFDADHLPKTAPASPQTLKQLQRVEAELHERDEKLVVLLSDKRALDDELQRLRAEIAEAKKANAAQPDTHDYSEQETRDFFIDLLLKEAGWTLDQPRDREFPVSGMPNKEGKGFVDYVLWGDDGKPLALVEAKRARRDPRAGQQQAKLYADCLEKQFGQRPVIFYSNGYEHWIWDDANHPPRRVQGFYKKAELELAIQRRTTRKALSATPINEAIAGRYYQTRAVRRIGEAFEQDRDRKALVVMATGAGKTRTVIALVDLLMRCNWAKRVLFLADRVALVNQAVNAFKTHLGEAAPVNLVTDKDTEGRIYASTYPTMMGLIDEARDGQRRFGAGHFDLIIIDEAHRSVFQKYRAIFDYFDSLLVGLTATPKDEVDRNTYALFDLEKGVPTDAYALPDAVGDGFLVPARAVSVPLKFQREGIRYEDLSADERDAWEALDWDEEEGAPDSVEAEVVNKWLFNIDTVDKVLEVLMTRGLKVAGGDRLGKTIIFAKNNAHAEFIADRFNANYKHHNGKFARVVTFKTKYAQSLIDAFSDKDQAPHIAISVDMLDTGIDVPEVVNLVFFKVVRSKTKFMQMVGRGTRLCPDLFGPAEPKAFFYLFDFCQNLEFFNENPEVTDGSVSDSLGKRLFKGRLKLIEALDRPELAANPSAWELVKVVKQDTAALLHAEVAAMSLDNFVVRPKRRQIEQYAQPDAWTRLTPENLEELANHVAGLPSEQQGEAEEAKRFDLLVLNLQLSLLRSEARFKRLQKQVRTLVGELEEKASIPMVNAQLALIQDVQTDEWWQDVTVPMLEAMRRKLRELVTFIEKRRRVTLYTDFQDELGEGQEIALRLFDQTAEFERFKAKVQAFLRAHQDNIVIHKLRMNKALTAQDLSDLERILAESGAGTPQDIQRAASEAEGLGLFVRSLVGLDREAAKQELAGFFSGATLSSQQIEFVNHIVEHLTANGVMAPDLLYETPFTDVSPQGPDGLFSSQQVDALIAVLNTVKHRAMAG